jgi:endonuclease G, mitochondrial
MFLRAFGFFFIPVAISLISGFGLPLKNVLPAGAVIDSCKKYMPAIKEQQELVIHKAFILAYSEKHEQASWVQYILSAEMCENKGEERTDNFRADKAVTSGSSSPEDYKKSGYDRGHLCPAGDMGWDAQAMSVSFLMSNMRPQLPGFNRGIW